MSSGTKKRSMSLLRQNPLLLPRPELVDTLFDVVAYHLKTCLEYYEKLPKIDTLTLTDTNRLFNDILKLSTALKCFMNGSAVPAHYGAYDVSIAKDEIRLKMKNIGLKIKRLHLDEDFFEKLDDLTEKVCAYIDMCVKRIKSGVIPEPSQLYLILDVLQQKEQVVKEYIDFLNMFSSENKNFLDTLDSDRFLKDYCPKLPDGWFPLTNASSEQLSKTYRCPAVVANATLNIPFNISLSIKEKISVLGSCGYNKLQNTIDITVNCLNFEYFSLFPLNMTIEDIYGVLLHECVHLLQALMGQSTNNFDYTGLPYPRQDQYLFYNKEAEKALKLEYEINGLDPDLVSFHILDDVEFYSNLLDEIVEFLRQQYLIGLAPPCQINTEDQISAFIESRRFFRVLGHFQKDKYDIAVQEFKDAVRNHASSFERDYVCKIIDARSVKKNK